MELFKMNKIWIFLKFPKKKSTEKCKTTNKYKCRKKLRSFSKVKRNRTKIRKQGMLPNLNLLEKKEQIYFKYHTNHKKWLNLSIIMMI